MNAITSPLAPLQLEEAGVVKALSALAQPQRLRAFRALVVAGEQGLTPGALSVLLDIAPSGLSFHLKELTHSGLVNAEPRGRNLIYRAAYAQTNALLSYLGENCCAADPEATGCGC
jgi:ArsR family transcriptional regulator, arsenate/arsenite/antimonite-responsive transcriptional repressor